MSARTSYARALRDQEAHSGEALDGARSGGRRRRGVFERAVHLRRDVQVAGVRLRVHEWPGRAGPIVCLPDLGSDGAVFEPLAGLLSPDYRVLALDPRGQGGSQAPLGGYGYQVTAADAGTFLDQFGFEDGVLVGAGYGGTIALLVAAWRPERVAALVLLDGGAAPAWAAAAGEAASTRQGRSPRDQEVRAFWDGPPDYARLYRAIVCRTLVVRGVGGGVKRAGGAGSARLRARGSDHGAAGDDDAWQPAEGGLTPRQFRAIQDGIPQARGVTFSRRGPRGSAQALAEVIRGFREAG